MDAWILSSHLKFVTNRIGRSILLNNAQPVAEKEIKAVD